MEKHTTIAVDLSKTVFEIAVSDQPGRVCERKREARPDGGLLRAAARRRARAGANRPGCADPRSGPSRRPGRTPGEVWEQWAKTLAEGGYPDTYRRAGYSIGVNYPPDWGEGYIIGFQRGENRPLQKNMTFHVPSIVKHFGLANVGFSETIRVTDNGCEVLTQFEDSIRV